jgi:hypothetical protein
MSPNAGEVDGCAATLRAIHDVLAACHDLRPGPVVDDAFGRLVRCAIDTPDEFAHDVLAHDAGREVADDLRALCCEGERQLEIAWADRIAASADPAAELERFPYLANYRQLCAMEQAAVCRLAGAGPARIAFVGSGPLPLTAFLLGGGGTPVDNVDRDHAALDMSRWVTSALGLTSWGSSAATPPTTVSTSAATTSPCSPRAWVAHPTRRRGSCVASAVRWRPARCWSTAARAGCARSSTPRSTPRPSRASTCSGPSIPSTTSSNR